MHRPSPQAMMAALILALPGIAPAAAPNPLEQARAALARDDGRTAAPILEAAVAEAPPARRPALLADLRRAYELAARQADADKQPREARGYRENLLILNRKAPAPARAPEPTPEPKQEPEPAPKPAHPEPVGTPEPKAMELPDTLPALDPPAALPALDELPPPAVPVAKAPPKPAVEPDAEPVAMPPAADPIGAADAAFREGKYDEAGRAYAALAKAQTLPADRRDHWAYCRMAGVVERINAGPKSAADWASLDAEIERIRALSPKNWFGEYLRNLVARRPAPARPGDSEKLVLRAAAPEEAGVATRRRPADDQVQLATAASEPEAAPAAPKPAAAQAPADGKWQVRVTANFRILHADPALAERVARAAETARESQVRRWVGNGPRTPWTPKCDIYLYPDAASYARMTGQPADSPGFSVMGQSGGKIVARRVNLRVDHPNLATAILPHEVTHVVLADLFPTRPLPRWADEGMAVLAEPAAEQANRAKDLADPLASGKLFPIDRLVAMDSPEGQHWGLYYAQSVSLTRFLVAQGTPAQFIKFLQGAERNGVEPELRRTYKINGYSDLQSRWLAYAKTAPAEETAALDEPERR